MRAHHGFMDDAATTQTEAIPEPTISMMLMERIQRDGVDVVKAEMKLPEERFVAMVKGHAFAIFCWQNQEFGQAIGYQPKFVGDYGETRWN